MRKISGVLLVVKKVSKVDFKTALSVGVQKKVLRESFFCEFLSPLLSEIEQMVSAQLLKNFERGIQIRILRVLRESWKKKALLRKSDFSNHFRTLSGNQRLRKFVSKRFVPSAFFWSIGSIWRLFLSCTKSSFYRFWTLSKSFLVCLRIFFSGDAETAFCLP